MGNITYLDMQSEANEYRPAADEFNAPVDACNTAVGEHGSVSDALNYTYYDNAPGN